jgi:hypothetical protein
MIGALESTKFNRTQIYADNRRNKKDAMRIALSAKRLFVYIRVQKGISYTIKLSPLTLPLSLANGGEGKSTLTNWEVAEWPK